MFPVKLATALTVPFFAHDASGDGVTGLVDGGFTKRISKNGAAFGAMTVTVTEMENGFYSLPLSTSHTDTLGILTISISHASIKRCNLQFRVDTNLPGDAPTAAQISQQVGDELASCKKTVNRVNGDIKTYRLDGTTVRGTLRPTEIDANTQGLIPQ
jgi:hypothetical protein